MTEYTVLTPAGDQLGRHLTPAQAANEIMTYDGHEFSIEPEPAGGWRLLTTAHSRNSTAYCGLSPSVIFSLATDRPTGEAEIFAAVMEHAEWWRGCDVMSDAAYDEMRAEADE